jgi:hypothetical protein
MRSERFFWGLLLIMFGGLFLFENLGYISFSFDRIWRYWPVLLIYWGFSALLKRKDGQTNPIMIGIQILLLVLVLYSVINPQNRSSKNLGHDSKNDKSIPKERKYDFEAPLRSGIEMAALDIEFGAGTIELGGNSEKLMAANASSRWGSYSFETTEKDDITLLSLEYTGKNIQWDNSQGFNNAIDIQLNDQTKWQIKLDMGAAEAKLDLRDYQIKELDIEGGAFDLDIILGEVVGERSMLEISSGAADIDIQLPQDVPCEIITESGLSSKEFEGFEKISNGLYRTPGFDKSQKSWLIKLETGLSSIHIHR